MNTISSGSSLSTLILILVISLSSGQVLAKQQRPPRPAGPPGSIQPAAPIGLDNLRTEVEDTDSPEEKMMKFTGFILENEVIHPDSIEVMIDMFSDLVDIGRSEKEGYIDFLRAIEYARILPDSSYFYGMKAMPVLKEFDDHQTYLINNMSIAKYLNQRGRYVEAQTLYLEAIKLLEENDNTEAYKDVQLISVYQALANLYTRARATDLALNIFDKLLEKDLDESRRCGLVLSKSNALSMGERLQEAYDILIPCLELYELPTQMKVVINTTLGRLSGRLDKRDQAVRYYEQALSFYETETIPFRVLTDRRVFLAEAYLNNDMLSKADSLKIIIESEAERLRPDIEIYKNIVFARISYANQQYGNTVEFANEAIALAERMNMELNLQDVHVIKSEALEALGRYSEALDVMREFNTMNKLRDKAIKEREMAAVNVQYQLTVRENELMSATQTIESLSTKMTMLILSIIIILALAIVVYYRNRMKFIVKEEQTRNKIARDLHDDLSGTLSSISFFSEAAIRTIGKAEQENQYLSMIDKSAIEAKEKINDIIWAINPENDDWESFITKCKRFAAESFESQNISYELYMDDITGVKTTLELRQNLWLIIKETITNLMRHSEATSAKLSLRLEGKELIYSITDDGKGISQKESESGNGLKNIRYRVNNLGGYSVMNSGDNGTEWEIRIPV